MPEHQQAQKSTESKSNIQTQTIPPKKKRGKCMLNKKSSILASTSLILILTMASIVCAAPFAYITNEDSNNVSVIDTATDTVVATVSVGIQPYGVAVSPDGAKVYVTNLGDYPSYEGTVSVIDTATNTAIATVPVGIHPFGVAVSPDGSKVYVANSGIYPNNEGTVSVINTTTNTVTATVDDVGSSSVGVAVNPDGSNVYITNLDGYSVSVINTTTNTVTATVDVEMMPFGIAVTPDGTQVYVANRGAASVSVIDTATNTVTATVNRVGSNPKAVAVNPDGSKVYVINELSKNVAVIDTATNTITATVPLGIVKTGAGPVDEWVDGVSVTPDGTKVYVAKDNSSGGSVQVIDTATNTVIGMVKVGSLPVAFGQFIGTRQNSTEETTTLGETPSTVSQIKVITDQASGKTIILKKGDEFCLILINMPGARDFWDIPNTVLSNDLKLIKETDINLGSSGIVCGPVMHILEIQAVNNDCQSIKVDHYNLGKVDRTFKLKIRVIDCQKTRNRAF
jgi:YVTN family beta-propeller protein